jgi:outer membrane protein OmpA-like peptidoglycan-associated protein
MVYKTNPLVVDTDLDKLTDYDEVMVYKTNPLKADTDEDGLTDYEEVMVYKTNPLKADTDEDQLMDAEEVIKYKTNPNSKDTDLGTIDDYTEIVRGTNPLVEEDDIIVIGVPIVLEGITFDVNKATIRPESEATLMKALKTLQTYSDISVEIDGYTDSDGSAKSNQILSESRADAVKNWLISKGIEAGRISAAGYGEENPIADNTTKEGKAKNRRIEFKRVK